MKEIPERDWKFLGSIKAEMLEELSGRIVEDIRKILERADISQNEKRREIYGLVHDRDRIIAACFDDWRRSTLIERCWALRRYGLLEEPRLKQLHPETQERILTFEKEFDPTR